MEHRRLETIRAISRQVETEWGKVLEFLLKQQPDDK